MDSEQHSNPYASPLTRGERRPVNWPLICRVTRVIVWAGVFGLTIDTALSIFNHAQMSMNSSRVLSLVTAAMLVVNQIANNATLVDSPGAEQ